MKNYNLTLLQKMGMNNELKQKMLEAEGVKGVGVYLTLDHMLRHTKDYRIRIAIVPSIALNLHVSMRYVLKIIKEYGLFVIDGEEFYSPEITDLMLRLRVKIFQSKEKKLQSIETKKKSLIENVELKEVKKEIATAIKNLNDSKLKTLEAQTKINYISQFKLREREKEKRENASGGRQKNPLAARNFSQQDVIQNGIEPLNEADGQNIDNDSYQKNGSQTTPDNLGCMNIDNSSSGQAKSNSGQAKPSSDKTRRSSGRVDYSGGEVNVLQAAESLQGNGPLPIKNALQRCGEVKLWSDWADEMLIDNAYMELMAMHSHLGKRFIENRKRIVELFKNHVESYSKYDGLITQNDVRYYFANFLRPESLTWKELVEKLQEEEEARKAADPYRFEKRVNGVRMYPGGGEIPDDATPRPSMYAVWSEISKSWVGK